MKSVNIRQKVYYDVLQDLYTHCSRTVKIKGGIPWGNKVDYTLLVDFVILELYYEK